MSSAFTLGRRFRRHSRHSEPSSTRRRSGPRLGGLPSACYVAARLSRLNRRIDERAHVLWRASKCHAFALSVVAVVTSPGCGADGSKPDIESARQFRAFPLYWVGRRFENWDVTRIEGVNGRGMLVSFIYGDCTPAGGEQPSCTPPF